MLFKPQELDNYPVDAGVYLMKNSKGIVIYVGKAKSLKKRLKQYFVPGRDTRPTLPLLVTEIASIETLIVPTEKEALILENALIKKHQPKFNILLKDDKNYISLSIHPKEKWPRLQLVRFKDKPPEGTLHFGPYPNTAAARQTYELMSRLFPLRQCSDEELKRRSRPCLLYSMKRCIAPCMSLCSEKEYGVYVSSAIDFLKGNNQKILDELIQEMEKASDALEFEKAAALLRTIQQIKHVTQEKTIFQKSQERKIDAIGLYREGDRVLISCLVFRGEDLLHSETFSCSQILEEEEEILATFLVQRYQTSTALPEEILLPMSLSQEKEIFSLLCDIHPKKSFKILAPQKGDRKALIDLAQKNAKSTFHQKASLQRSQEELLLQLQESFSLSRYPKKIECFDTSNLADKHLVAASSVFIDGKEDKKKMRLYHIKGFDKPNDYAALHQVLTRRIIRAKEEEDFPDLLLIDGGKGQLNIALEVLNEQEIIHVDVISLVKEDGRHDKGMTLEKVYIPGKSDPIALSSHSPLLFFLQKIRDAAHEKAISFYRNSHRKTTIQSAIEEIPGIGPIKRKRLLQSFGSLQNILSQTEAELKKIPGITSKDVDQIKKFQNK
ncbi:MAG: excinuclease ABC subunit UvrC [Rhabdochlamydiaceae bacterium]|nr:excinuclease ABC subunit UvrC [Rhabdochlamydiaceae bacterium]